MAPTRSDAAGGAGVRRHAVMEALARRAPLGRLILRRLAWAVPTLFGVSLVTFALVQLAPGEIGGGTGAGRASEGAEQEESKERLRRTYGFDLPLFFNTEIMDRGRRVRAALAELGRAPTAPLARRKLLGLGTLAFPELAEALGRSGPGPARDRMRAVADGILGATGAPEREALAKGPASGYLVWWRARAARFSDAAIQAVLDRWRRGDEGARVELRAIGQRAVPMLWADLLAGGTPGVERWRVSLSLAEITGHVVIYEPSASLAERRSALGQWRDWWRAEETVYRDLTSRERVVGFFTRTQYARWVSRLATGDFGESSYHRRRAWDVIAERLPVTLWLNLAALMLAYLIGIPLGVFSAARRGRRADRVLGAGLLLLYSLPVYWVGLMLVSTLGGLDGPGLFPSGGLRSFQPEDAPLGSGGLDVLWHAALPVICLSYGALAVVSRYQRVGMIDALGEDYIRTARSKGLTEGTVVWRHGFPNGTLPVINLLGLQIPYLLSGSVIVETIFDLPGLGSLVLLSIHQRDTNVLMGLISLTAVLSLVGLLLADLLMMWVDPRIGYATKVRT